MRSTFCYISALDLHYSLLESKRTNEKHRHIRWGYILKTALHVQVCFWKGDQEEEVSVWAAGSSPTSADVRLLSPHHRPTSQHHAPKKVRLSCYLLSFELLSLRCPHRVHSHYAWTINLGIKGIRFSYASKSIILRKNKPPRVLTCTQVCEYVSAGFIHRHHFHFK